MSWGGGIETTAQAQAARGRRVNARRILLLLGWVIILLSGVRWITGTPELTSSGTYGAALRLAVPILLAGLGGLYSERTGVANIGLEGMMILGTWFGAWGGLQFGVWWGVVLGILSAPALPSINELFVLIQPAHVQKLAGKELESDERDQRRATLLRERFA